MGCSKLRRKEDHTLECDLLVVDETSILTSRCCTRC
jgi:hypothetical protein